MTTPDLIQRLRFLASGQDDVRSLAITEAADELERLRAQVAPLREFVERVSKQKPEKPDYWSGCGQCEHNISEAEDLLAASPAAPAQQAGQAPAPAAEQPCYCGEHVSLQMVSGGAAPEGYLGRVTIKIDGQYVDYFRAPAVGAGDERQDVGGHIRAAANARVAQQADDDTRRLDYLQKKQATISLVPDGRDEKGTRHAFMVGGWHCSVNRDVRASIDAAMGESHVPVQGSE